MSGIAGGLSEREAGAPGNGSARALVSERCAENSAVITVESGWAGTPPFQIGQPNLRPGFQAIPIDALQLACICRLRNLRRTVIASNAVTASSVATMINTDVQLPVVCLRNAAAGPPKIEPTPCAI